MGAVGLPAVIVDLIIVVGTLGLGILFGRILKMDKETALMTATGSAICGAAAVLGAEPVVKCEPHKTAVAVTTVVLFGTLAMFLYPILFRAGLFGGLDNMGVAVYSGATLHEVAHVVGAGNAMDPAGTLGIDNNATIVKMIRVMMLAPILVIMGILLPKRGNNTSNGKTKITIPCFAFWFLAVIVLNSAIQFGIGENQSLQTTYSSILSGINYFDTFLLTMAMTALGTDTNFAKFKQAGVKPFILAGILFAWLLVGGYAITVYILPLFM